MQRHGEILARRAHGGRAPQVHDQPARPVAVVLQVAAQQFLGHAHALGMGGGRRHGAGIDGIKIAPRRQHVAPPAMGRTRGAGRDPPPRQRREQARHLAIGCAIDVQPVAEPGFLEVADKAVDAGDRLGRAGVRGQAQVVLDPGQAGLVADRGDQAVAAGGVQPVGGRIFVKQHFQPGKAGPAGRDQRRRHVAQRHRADPAAGLRGLARIVHDEGIDHRQARRQRLGPAVGGQGDRLAGQPFQRAMRTDMDHGVNPQRPQPQVEGDIAVAWNAGQVVVFGIARPIAAFGLQGDQRRPAPNGGKAERPRRNPRIVLGPTPGGGQRLAQRRGQRLERGAIIGERPGFPGRQQRGRQRVAGRRVPARRPKSRQHGIA